MSIKRTKCTFDIFFWLMQIVQLLSKNVFVYVWCCCSMSIMFSAGQQATSVQNTLCFTLLDMFLQTTKAGPNKHLEPVLHLVITLLEEGNKHQDFPLHFSAAMCWKIQFPSVDGMIYLNTEQFPIAALHRQQTALNK